MENQEINILSEYKVAYPALPYPNYGSTLQAVALYNLVELLGYQCNLINFAGFVDNPRPTYEDLAMLGLDEDAPGKFARDISDSERKRLENKVMRYRFEKFCKKIFTYDESLKALSTGGDADRERVSSYDAFICGSDQVWNPRGNWFTPANYLQFAPRGKRIGYAASLGLNRVLFSLQEKIPLWKHYLSEMTFLSGREERSSEVLRQVSGREVTTVLDPTLMFSASQWDTLVTDRTLPANLQRYIDEKRPYILAYLLHGHARYKESIERYAREKNYEIAWITGTDVALERGVNRIDTNPGGLLSLFASARAVCTDSFHGTCFSIIFQKPFVSVLIGGMNRNERIFDIRKFDLLDRMGIPERAVSEADFSIIDRPVDYESIQEPLARQQKISRDYLSNALSVCSERQVTEADLPCDLRLLPVQQTARTIERVPLDDPLNCTGCGACGNICPADAISMRPNDKGFLEPVVDDAKCLRCGACLKRCPLRARPKLFREVTPYAYASWSLDPEIILNSSTGGIFSVLSDWVLERKGVVYGSALDNKEHSLSVRRASNQEELAPLRGSKYVQSDVGMSFRAVLEDLKEGRHVLFAGTSCQIAGLYAFLGKDYDRLLTVDLICGGVVSPLVYKKYVAMRERQAGAPVREVRFRSKERGWGSLQFRMEFENGKIYKSLFDTDPYGFMYLKKMTTRTSCHRCVYKGLEGRLADFTIGDFWGIGKDAPFEHAKSQGVSAVTLNSIKARIIFQHIRALPGILFTEERSVDEMLRGNPVLLHRPRKPVVYNMLFKCFAEKDFRTAFVEMFGPDDVREKIAEDPRFSLDALPGD